MKVLLLFVLSMTNACSYIKGGVTSTTPVDDARQYAWTKVVDAAPFKGAYNFPVFTVGNEMWAFHHEGNWRSTDGKAWTKSELPASGLNSGYQKYVLFNNAVYALGTMEGNYTNMRLTSRIMRTSDFKSWQVLAETSELPSRVFYGALVFKDKIWLFGGYDGKSYYNDVWNSSDGVHWSRVSEHAQWSARLVNVAAVFKDRIWIIGGGLIDGEPTDGRAEREVWSSADGINWTRATDGFPHIWGASPIVYDGRLWLVGSNRDGQFTRAVLISDDGINWREQTAPWSPRGGAATWIFDNKLYMTGGKFSVTENGNIRFIYSNDVWYMAAPRT